MTASFIASLREALQAGLIAALLLQYPSIRAKGPALIAGALAGLAAGLSLHVTASGDLMTRVELWMGLRHVAEGALYLLGVSLLAGRVEGGRWMGPGLFAAGFFITVFEARTLGFFMLEQVREHGDRGLTMTAGAAGALIGIALWAAAIGKLGSSLRIERFFSLASIVIAAGALNIIMGGVGEVESIPMSVALEGGIRSFTSHAVESLRAALLLDTHPFIRVPWTGLFDYFAGERLSTALLVLVMTLPPVLVLADVFAHPDPDVRGLRVAAERRLKVAFFRREMAFRAGPMLAVFIAITVLIHAGNVSINPWTEPEPIPVQPSEAAKGELRIPLSDRLGEYTDGKLRKYLYYHGSKRILFLAIMKPDKTIGVGLDECEICEPAEWNKDAWGYAQQGTHLVCKYCMTPIPIPTLNEPGGCNPVPVPFQVDGGAIRIKIDDLVRVYDALKAMDKKGTHF